MTGIPWLWAIHTSSRGFKGFFAEVSFCTFKMLVLMRAAITPRWSNAMVLAALLSVWELVFTSSREDTYTSRLVDKLSTL